MTDRSIRSTTNHEENLMNRTLADLIDSYGVDVDEHHQRDLTVPVHGGLQFQGDVAVVPAAVAGRHLTEASRPVCAEGFAVVRGESGGNTHLLLAHGDVRFDARPASVTDLALGTLTVGPDSTAYLAHPEHAYTGIAPGTYELRRQREQADEIRMVAD